MSKRKINEPQQAPDEVVEEICRETTEIVNQYLKRKVTQSGLRHYIDKSSLRVSVAGSLTIRALQEAIDLGMPRDQAIDIIRNIAEMTLGSCDCPKSADSEVLLH